MTSCPNCSAAALGTDAASVCMECASVSVVGASFNVPMIILAATGAVAMAFAYRVWRRTPRLALA